MAQLTSVTTPGGRQFTYVTCPGKRGSKVDPTPGNGKNISESILEQRKIAYSYFEMRTYPQIYMARIFIFRFPRGVKIPNVPQGYLGWTFSP